MLKKVSNSASVLKFHFLLLPHDRDGMSVIAFWFPGMGIGVRGNAPFAFVLNASTRNNRAVTLEPFAAMHLTHPMVGKLLLNSLVCASLRSTQTYSITSHNNNRSGHSRSKFVIVPPEFALEIKLAVISACHHRRKTVGLHVLFLPTMTPPTTWPEASLTPI